MLTDDINETNSYVSQANEQMDNLASSFTFLKENFRGDQSILNEVQEILNEAKPYRADILNLASKSAEASKETSTLIESTVEAVQKGTSIANATAQSLEAVVENSLKVVASVDKIAAAEQQAASITQVTTGIDQIFGVVQTNSATAEESAAASEELSGQAQMLKSLISQFKLNNSQETDYSNMGY